jgi:diaminohydroxyphosphoribosylaminopyrimidine deaminase/5-amino-6-(5-phosphoribosylamino)uracil reductase
MLRAAGIAVTEGVLEAACIETVAGFFKRLKEGRPFVTVKSAMSLDGRIATAAGESQWITGPEARLHGHVLRSRHDAILSGSGTVVADDPLLTVRPASLSRRAPVRVVVDTRLRIPPQSQLVRSAKDVPVWVLCGPQASADKRAALAADGVQIIEAPVDGQGLDLDACLRDLGSRGLTRVLVEGGGALIGGLARAGLVDRIVAYRAGVVLGGDALAAVAPAGVARLADATRYSLIETERCGADVVETWDAAR